MEREIKNKKIVITGGADGIGFQIARSFLKAGAALAILLDINEEKGNQAVEQLTTEHGSQKAVFMKCDVVNELEEISQKIIRDFGSVDILVNSAGLCNERNIDLCIDVNLKSLIKWSCKFIKLMKKDDRFNGGTIINVASVFGYLTDDLVPIYSASKHGVVGFTKCMGLKTGKEKKVRVFAICPSFTSTNMTKFIEDDTVLLTHYKNEYEWQSAEVVGEKTIEIFKIAESGSIWEIAGGKLKEIM